MGKSCLLRLCCLALLASPLIPFTDSNAAPADLVESRRHDLEEQQSVIARLHDTLRLKRDELNRLRSLEDSKTSPVTPSMVEEARMEKEGAEIELQSIALDALASERQKNQLNTAVEQLQRKLKEARGAKSAQLEQQLAEKQNLLELEKNQQSLIEERSQLIKERLQLAKDYWIVLSDRYEVVQSSQREEALANLEKRIKQEEDELLTRTAQLNERLSTIKGSSPAAEADKSLLQTQIKEAEESGYLLKLQLQAEKSAFSLKHMDADFNGKEPDAPRLPETVAEIDRISEELQSTLSLANSKLSVLQQLLEVKQKRQPVGANAQQKARQEQQIIASLIEQFKEPLASLQRVAEQARTLSDAIHKAYQANIKRSLTARHHLPSELFEWKALTQEALELPTTLFRVGLDAGGQFFRAFVLAGPVGWISLLGIGGVWFLPWRHLQQRIPALQAARPKRSASFSATALEVSLSLVRNNRLGLLFAGLTLFSGWIVAVDERTFSLLTFGWALWFGSRLPVGIAYWLLMSPLVARAEWNRNIYRIVLWFVTLSALLALYLLLGYLEIITSELTALAERAFMLFIACSFLAALHIRPKVLDWLQARVASKRWMNIAGLASFMFLAFMLGASLLGVAGYINLAWAMSAYLAWLLLVVMGWYITRGVVQDLFKTLTNQVLKRSPRGVLWAQDIIDPFQQLTRILLAFAAGVVLFHILGWDAESPIVLTLGHALTYPLIKIGEQSFDATRLLLTALFVAVMLGVTRWIRKFCFRWIYAGVSDIGLRNSLSVFTQYGFFLVGAIITLKMLGLDLTSLALFTGAVGVGIGLGLQSIANNFISGIILLIERPLRAKDLVTVAGVEGEVKTLGIRAVTVKTGDNQEVIIPNAEIVGHPLINWTRSDRVLRTTFTVAVSYNDDPRQAQSLILDAVGGHPAVLKDPAPSVWLNEFAAAGISYQVQFFVNIEQSGRAEVKSQLLLAIWDALKGAGMTIPAPAAKT